MTKVKNKNKLTIIVAVFLLALFVGFVFKINNNSYTSLYDQTTREYTSTPLRINFIISSNFQISEGVNSLSIKNSLGEISITRQGTNYSSLNNYLQSLNLKITNVKTMQINGYSTLNGLIDSKYYYFIYINNWVYAMSTSSPKLYDDLDQIARSFRYTP